MELKWLEDLLVLIDEGSISRAAKRRHVTQPAFSRRIRQLEHWLGAELVDRATKPIGIRAGAREIERDVRELVNRFYALRNQAQETGERVTFVAQHSLAISRFPKLIRRLRQRLPETGYRVITGDYEQCEALFHGAADLMLCYQSEARRFDTGFARFQRIDLGQDCLMPVGSPALLARLGELRPEMTLPLLLYQRGGFFGESLAGDWLPAINRDYRVEIICESAFSASLKEMALADMGIAWLTRDIVARELERGELLSLAPALGQLPLDIVLFCKDQALARRVGDALRPGGVTADVEP